MSQISGFSSENARERTLPIALHAWALFFSELNRFLAQSECIDISKKIIVFSFSNQEKRRKDIAGLLKLIFVPLTEFRRYKAWELRNMPIKQNVDWAIPVRMALTKFLRFSPRKFENPRRKCAEMCYLFRMEPTKFLRFFPRKFENLYRKFAEM